jgi:hypothetical protein
VLDDLEAATEAYRAAQAAVEAAERSIVEARARVPETRERLYIAMVAAARAGVRQSQLVKVTGFNREHVRRVLRARGVEPAE